MIKAVLVALSLFFSAACFASPPLKPCPEGETCQKAVPRLHTLVVPVPAASPTAPTSDDDDDMPDILKAILAAGAGHAQAPIPNLCPSHPCVPAYRFAGPVNQDSAEKFTNFIQAATASHAEGVMIELNTLGGSNMAGHEISRQIEHAPFHVTCVVDGDAVSMGMYILASCDTRVMTKRSELMIHTVHLKVSEDETVGIVNNVNMGESMRTSTRAYIEWVIHGFKGVTYAQALAKVVDGHEWWMDWEQALKVGAVDEVISITPDKYLAQMRKPVARR